MTEQPQQGSSSALKVLGIVFLVLLLLAIVIVGSCVYCVASNPDVRKMTSLMGESMKMTMAAAKAPGTQELRDAGCEQAMVMDMRGFWDKVEKIGTEDERFETPEKPAEEWTKLTVICQFTREPSLTCEQAARVYVGAVPDPPEEFGLLVRVVAAPEVREACQGVFGHDGSRIKDMEHPPTAPGFQSGNVRFRTGGQQPGGPGLPLEVERIDEPAAAPVPLEVKRVDEPARAAVPLGAKKDAEPPAPRDNTRQR